MISPALRIGRHDVAISNPDKVFFPEPGLSKGDLVEYYLGVAGCALPHLRRRPFHMKRFPNGVEGDFFHQKRVPAGHPGYVDEVPVSFPSGHSTVFAVVDNAAALAWVVNLGCIELHTWHSRVPEIELPDYLLIDLDPSTDGQWPYVRRIALVVREVMDELGLASYPKTSGATGLHILAPGPGQHDIAEAGERFPTAELLQGDGPLGIADPGVRVVRLDRLDPARRDPGAPAVRGEHHLRAARRRDHDRTRAPEHPLAFSRDQDRLRLVHGLHDDGHRVGIVQGEMALRAAMVGPDLADVHRGHLGTSDHGLTRVVHLLARERLRAQRGALLVAQAGARQCARVAPLSLRLELETPLGLGSPLELRVDHDNRRALTHPAADGRSAALRHDVAVWLYRGHGITSLFDINLSRLCVSKNRATNRQSGSGGEDDKDATI